MTISETILQQLGGNKFIAMTGAKNFIGDKNTLRFTLPSRKANRVVITLNIMDTYDMIFYRVRGIDVKWREEVEGVYADQLQKVFTSRTGLFTQL